MNDKRAQLKAWIEESGNIVFFGGAGVSTESGVPDFRSRDGLYSLNYKYPPEEIVSHTFFMRQTEEFYRFYRDRMIIRGVQPNAAHLALAKLEAEGKLKAVVTQNIDGLHQAAGSRNVLELHGATAKNHCMSCNAKYSLDEWIEWPEGTAPAGDDRGYSVNGVPHCHCGGIIKPDVVLYEESLDYDVMQAAVDAIAHADMLIIGGTSLVVYPAAGMVDYYRGHKLVVINKSATPRDSDADLVIAEPIGEVFAEVCGI